MLNNESTESTEFTFSYRKELPLSTAAHVWKRWSLLSSWQDWDQSLSGTQAASNSIALGQCFCVVPKMTGKPIPVTVISAVDGLHFTTASAGPVGLMAFGHTLIVDAAAQIVKLEHSICMVPADADFFRARMWDRLKTDVTASVQALGHLVVKDYMA